MNGSTNENNFTYLTNAIMRQYGALFFLMDWNSFYSVEVCSFKNLREIISGEGRARAGSRSV